MNELELPGAQPEPSGPHLAAPCQWLLEAEEEVCCPVRAVELCAALLGALMSQHPRTALGVLVLSLAQDPAPCFQRMTLQWLQSR